MTTENIEMMNAFVLIRPDDGYDKIKLGKTEIQLDTSFEPEQHAQTSGVVIKPCKKLYFNHDDKNSCAFDSDIEIQAGDRVWFHFLVVENAMAHGTYVTIDGVDCIAIPYTLLYARKRGEDIMGLNGWFLVEPHDEELPKTSLMLPDTAKGKKSKLRGVVLAKPTPLRGYYAKRDLGPDRGEVKLGDVVHFRKVDAVPLQYEFHANAIGKKKLYRMQEKDMLCIL